MKAVFFFLPLQCRKRLLRNNCSGGVVHITMPDVETGPSNHSTILISDVSLNFISPVGKIAIFYRYMEIAIGRLRSAALRWIFLLSKKYNARKGYLVPQLSSLLVNISILRCGATQFHHFITARKTPALPSTSCDVIISAQSGTFFSYS